MDKKIITNNTKKTTFYLLLLITLIGIFVRLWQLSSHNLWNDEFFTLFIADRPLIEVIKFHYVYHMNSHHPPIYPILMHFVLYLGKSAWILRLPSVIFGVVAIPTSYLLSRELFTRKVGLITALILALSPLHVWMSQEARPYTLAPLVMITTFYFFLKFIKERNTKFLAWFVVWSIISLFTSYLSVLIVFAANLFILLNLKKYRNIIKKWIVYQIPVFLLVLFSVKMILSGYSGFKFYVPSLMWFVTIIPGIFNTANIGRFNPYINLGRELSFNAPFWNIFSSGPLMVVWILITAVFIYLFLRGLLSIKNKEKLNILFLFLFIPILVPYVLNIIIPFDFGAKRIIFAPIIYYIILAKGIIDSKRFTNLLIIFIVITSTISLGWYYYKYEQENWKSTAQYLEEYNLPGDIIVVVPEIYFNTHLKYYYKGPLEIKGMPPNIDYTDKDWRTDSMITKENVGGIVNLTKGYKRMWLVQNRISDPYSKGIMSDYLNENSDQFQLLKSEHFSDGSMDIYLYKINEES